MLKRFFIILVTLMVTFFYAKYSKNSFLEKLNAESSETGEVLQKLPLVEFDDLSGKKFNLLNNNEKRDHFFIHFWATWCAPCEAEFPEFLKLAKKFKHKMNFYLVAVNDDVTKIRKFIKKYDKYLFSNVVVLIDNNNEYYSKFGTAKVPETYLFNSDNEKLIRKFTGPQQWERPNYSRFLDSL